MTSNGELGWLGDNERLLWVAAIVLYGVGDAITTGIGLSATGATEIGPVVAPLVDRHGPATLVGVKAAIFALFYVAWRALWTPARVAVPLALTVVGGAVTAWNAAMIALA